MKIKISQIETLQAAIVALDGNHRAARVDEKTEKIVFEPYLFTLAVTRAKVKNIRLLRQKSEEVAETIQSLWAKNGGAGKTKLEGEQATGFKADKQQLLDTVEELELTPFKEADLNIYDPQLNADGNKIPATLLVDLGQLLA